MAEEQQSKPNRILVFVSGELQFGSALLTASTAVLAAAIFVYKKLETSESTVNSIISTVAVLVFFRCILLLVFAHRWTAEINPVARRLAIFKFLILRWTRIVLWTTVIEHCSFDECSKVGMTADNSDEPDSHGVYLDFKRGGRHVIPTQNNTLNEAAKAASELSAATGIPRQDRVR
ncbi:hypothetical protein [Bradyrhizobium sp. S69]|uniref:hypothetical protein n=1 Tax=Bradyrhizobium sp. S69 TaxID=1641856 RepID=UPI00131C2421|nr:hypothetical protein [Bradyrhizobium sp. S69]